MPSAARESCTHEFKKLLQERGMSPWKCDRTPLVSVGDHLAAAAEWRIGDPLQAAVTELGIFIKLVDKS